MTNSEFWSSTPFEVLLFVEGYGKRLDDQMKIGAWKTAALMNCWTKRRIKPKDLLPKSQSSISADQFASVHEFREYLAKRRKGA